MRPTFSPVEVRVRVLAIVASGPSLAGFDFSALTGVPIIAVNSAVLHCPARYWITIDPNHQQLRLMRKPRPGVLYYAGVPPDYGPRSVHHPFRVPLLEHVHYLRRVQAPGLSEDAATIHSGNSAFAALGLAYHMGAERVALFGVDGTREPYFYARPNEDWTSSRPTHRIGLMPELFESALVQLRARRVEVVNGSPASRVSCFPTMAPAEAASWLVSPSLVSA
jgi:hypothetical protein